MSGWIVFVLVWMAGLTGLIGGMYIGSWFAGIALVERAEEMGLCDEFGDLLERLLR